MKKILLIPVFMGISHLSYSQVGINTTTPNAQLEIKSSNQAAPGNTDGILIPKIDAFPVINPTAAQQGMLVYLTTVSAGRQPGFYYWDNTGTPQWKGIEGKIPDGTAVGNTMYWNGTTWVNNSNFLYNDGTNVGINTATPSSVLTVKKDGIGFTQESTSGASKVGFFTNAGNAWVQTHSNTDLAFATNNGGTQMLLQKATGNLGIGVASPTSKLDIQSSAAATVVSARAVTPANASNTSVFNAAITPSAAMNTGKILGLKNDLTSINAVEVQGNQNNISGAGTGDQYGVNNQFSSTGNAKRYGLFNSFNAANAESYGLYNYLPGTGSKFGIYNNFIDGDGTSIANFTNFNGSGNGDRYGNYTIFLDDGDGDWYGNYVYYEYLSSIGAEGRKFGLSVIIPPAVGGSELYGVYSYVGNMTNGYAGYFDGRISIGSNADISNHYILPVSKGTNGQIMQTDGAGNVTWKNPASAFGTNFWSTSGNSGTSAVTNFIGTTDDTDFVIRRNNIISGKVSASNTSLGVSSLLSVTGTANTAIGVSALNKNTSGCNNVAFGNSALFSQAFSNSSTAYNTNNTAIGVESLYTNNSTSSTNGINNTALGSFSLRANTIGMANTAIGARSQLVNTLGDYNTTLGYNSYPTTNNLSNYTGIGYNVGGASSASNMVEIGNTSVTSIRAQVTGITAYSDVRIKKNIKNNVPGLSFINKLNPVTYNLDIHKQNEILYKGDKEKMKDWEGKYDIEKNTQTGFIAQEVASAAQEAGYDFNGVDIPKNPEELYSINYTIFVVPLVKAVQEQQQIIDKQDEKIKALEVYNAEILKRLEKLEKK